MAETVNSSESRSDGFLTRAYALAGPDSARALYDEWAATYDDDMVAAKYLSPKRTVESIIKHMKPGVQDEIHILDAGCGTGSVGSCFAAHPEVKGRVALDGVDISQKMLDVAASTGAYKRVWAADLTKPLEISDRTYHVVTCVGTLTKAHLGPGFFRELVRVTASDGLIVATVHKDIWTSGGYEAEVNSLVETKLVKVTSTDPFEITDEKESATGIMVVLKKL